MDLFDRISSIFKNAQRNSAAHARCSQQLKAIYLNPETNFEDFMPIINKFINISLQVDYKVVHQYVDRVIAFIAMFCKICHEYHLNHVDPETDSPVVTAILDFLIDMTATSLDNNRYRACQFICKIFQELVGCDLTAQLCTSVQDCLVDLMDDKLAKVRMLAATALAPLQDLENQHCPVNSAYLNHLEFDSAAGVRKICAERLVLKPHNVQWLMHSSRDVDLNVRLAVYKRAANYPNKFRIIQKQQLINNGVKDKEEALGKHIAETMIPKWLQHYDNDYLKCMSAVRLDSTWEDLETTMKCYGHLISSFFSQRPTVELINVLKFNEKKLVDFEHLNYDCAYYWRAFLQHLRKKDGVGIEEYAPQLPDLCEYTEQFCIACHEKLASSQNINNTYENLEFQFVLVQIFHVLQGYDYVDVVCKRVALEMMKNVLKRNNLDVEVIKVIVGTLEVIEPDLNKQSKFICDIAGDLMYAEQENESKQSADASKHAAEGIPQGEDPTRDEDFMTSLDEQALDRLRLKCVMLEGDLEQAVRDQDYAKAGELKPLVDAAKQAFKEALNVRDARDDVAQPEDHPEEGHDEGEENAKRDLHHDPIVMRNVLSIMVGFLAASKLRKFNSIIASFKVNVIDEMIHSTSIGVKTMAFKCLSLCCTLDETTAQDALPVCLGIVMTHNRNAQNPPPWELVYACLAALIDPLITFGPKLLANANMTSANGNSTTASIDVDKDETNAGISMSSILKEILELLNDENLKLQELACRGICNYILTGRIFQQTVLSRIIVKYVLPTSHEFETQKIQQYIGVTLSKLPLNPATAPHFQKAILSSTKIILKAPANSPLSNVDVDHLSKLLLEILGQYPNGEELHRNVADSLIREIRDRPSSQINVTFSKMLLLLRFSQGSAEYFPGLLESLDDLRDRVHEPKVLSNITKFNTKITLLMTDHEQSAVAASEAHDGPDDENRDSQSQDDEDSN